MIVVTTGEYYVFDIPELASGFRISVKVFRNPEDSWTVYVAIANVRTGNDIIQRTRIYSRRPYTWRVRRFVKKATRPFQDSFR